MYVTVSLSDDHLYVCGCVKHFSLNKGFISWYDADIFIPFVSRQLQGPLSIVPNVKQTVILLQGSITQRPSQHDKLHTVRPDQTPFDHTDPDRCLYSCCRLNINSSQIVMEVAYSCTVLMLMYCEFIILCM